LTGGHKMSFSCRSIKIIPEKPNAANSIRLSYDTQRLGL
jgi:hypothetical protein